MAYSQDTPKIVENALFSSANSTNHRIDVNTEETRKTAPDGCRDTR
jgi:hypothetical protein